MRHTAHCLAVAVALAAPVALSVPAAAKDGRNAAMVGGAAAAGVIGGLAAGALLGAAPPPPPPPRVVAPVREIEEDDPVCRIERHKVWLDEDNYTYRRVEVCD